VGKVISKKRGSRKKRWIKAKKAAELSRRPGGSAEASRGGAVRKKKGRSAGNGLKKGEDFPKRREKNGALGEANLSSRDGMSSSN